jgi:tripartite-type tricarboxylate transporter receptor subunit TctC
MVRLLYGVVLVAPAALFGLPAAGAPYPDRPIRIVVPFPPGGTSDILTRLLGQKLTAAFGQQTVIDNRPGAGGVIATNIVAKANPDGYTLYMTFVSHAINPYVYAKLPYDTEKDFSPVALFALTPNVVVVTPSLAANSVRELIELAKAKPGQINYASAGVGTNSHLSAEMINSMAGVRMTHVPYKGAPQANADVAAGTVQVHIPSMPVAMPLIQSRRLKAIAVTSTKRSPALPDVPTVAETLPGYESYAWYGLTAPAGTPRAVIARVSATVEKALQAPDLIESYTVQGAEPAYKPPEEFRAYIKGELARWRQAVKNAGLKPGSL